MVLKHLKNYRFHNSLEAYEHAMQHGQKPGWSNHAERLQGTEAYLSKPGPPNTHQRWSQWGTRQLYIKRYYDPP